MGVNATMKRSTWTRHFAGLPFGRVGGLREAPLPTGAARRVMANRGALGPMSLELDPSHVAGDIVATC
jgi:hypothetical protein